MSNTLNKEITKEFYVDKVNGYQQLETRWKELIKSGYKPSVEQILLYQVLRGKDWTRSLTAISNKNKVNNGGWYESGVYRALSQIQNPYSTALSIFESIVSKEAISLIRSLLPTHYVYCASLDNNPIVYTGVQNALTTR